MNSVDLVELKVKEEKMGEENETTARDEEVDDGRESGYDSDHNTDHAYG
jgi:hypothetical protein